MLQLVLNKQTKLFFLTVLLSIQSYAADSIGGVIESSGTPGSILRETGEQLQADIDTDIASYDEVETQNGRLKLQFVDETQVSLTEHTYMLIDEYVYDPDPSKSKMALNFVQGTARFATGGLGLVPKENIQIQTPTATIGIRGTDFTTTVDELGRSLVILLPDENCDDNIKLEEGCAPSGSITVTNNGGTTVLEEAYQAVMVSTLETAPTQPVVLVDLNLNMIDNMFIVSKPDEIVQAEEEQAEQLKGGNGLLDFDGLDKDLLEIEDLGKAAEKELEFTEIDVNFLDVEFLNDLLNILETDMDVLAEEQAQDGPDKLIGTKFGVDPDTQFTSYPDYDGKIFITRTGTNIVSIKLTKGSTATIYVQDVDFGESKICLNNCEGTYIDITQN